MGKGTVPASGPNQRYPCKPIKDDYSPITLPCKQYHRFVTRHTHPKQQHQQQQQPTTSSSRQWQWQWQRGNNSSSSSSSSVTNNNNNARLPMWPGWTLCLSVN
eukprot:scaffold13523_cov39-Cyclotella_meneghiniana.AAC.5